MLERYAVKCLTAAFVLIVLAGGAPRAFGAAEQGSRPTLHMTLVDPGPIGAETTTNVYFAQVAVGGGYTTVFTLMNTGATAVNGTLFLTDQQGNPLTLNLNEPGPPGSGRLEAVGSNFPIGPIPPGGTKFFTATPLAANDPLRAGWARVENIGGSLGGVATFSQSLGGTLATIAGVLGSQTVNVATIPIDDDADVNRFTGYAVANTGAANITVKVVTVNEAGTVVNPNFPAQGLNPLPARQQVARFFFQDAPGPFKFRGSAVMIGQSNAQFAVVALVLNQGLLTAIPVIPEKAPAIN